MTSTPSIGDLVPDAPAAERIDAFGAALTDLGWRPAFAAALTSAESATGRSLTAAAPSKDSRLLRTPELNAIPRGARTFGPCRAGATPWRCWPAGGSTCWWWAPA
jgi:hypothetical protein